MTVECIAPHGTFTVGKRYKGKVVKAFGQGRLDLQFIPSFSSHPCLFLNPETLEPSGRLHWNRFKIVND